MAAIPGDEEESEFGKRPYQFAIRESQHVLGQLVEMEQNVSVAARWCVDAFRNKGKVIAFGNGGSACEAQHLAGELMGRYKSNRRPLAAMAVTADTAVLTCIGNDFSFDDVFARQVEGLAQPGDIVFAFSTSGNSANVVRAVETARKLQVRSVAFVGGNGGKVASLADCALVVPHGDTARIQEGHNFLMHSLMDMIEAELGKV